MAETLKPGDVVYLKSGGPMMTVVAVKGDKVLCKWLDRGKPKEEWFDAVTLEVNRPEIIEEDEA